MLALKALTLLPLDVDENQETLQIELKNIGLDSDWEIDSSLDVIIYYSKKSNVIRKLSKGL